LLDTIIGNISQRDKLIDFIMNLLIEVNENIILSYFNNLKSNDIETKSSVDDFVTIADKKSEDWLSSRLLGFQNISKFIGEETSYNNNFLNLLNEPLLWIIDPIDGTKNYVKGSSNFCSMISISSYGVPFATFVYQPLEKIFVYAIKGFGAYLINHKTQQKTQIFIPKLIDVNITGSGGTKGIPELHRNRIMNNLKSNTNRIFIGSAGIEAIMLALNKFQFIFHGRVTPWDHSPVNLIVEESGGLVLMARDREIFNIGSSGPILAASNVEIWEKVRNLAIPENDPYRLI